MAVGDKASCPKGGRAQYRNKPWYKKVGGRPQGEFMSKKTEREYGHGAFAGESCRFVTIEQKVSAIAKFYDEVCAAEVGVVRWCKEACVTRRALHIGKFGVLLLQVLMDTKLPNPARNARVRKSLKTLAKMMGRARAHSPKLLKKEYVYSVQSQAQCQ